MDRELERAVCLAYREAMLRRHSTQASAFASAVNVAHRIGHITGSREARQFVAFALTNYQDQGPRDARPL